MLRALAQSEHSPLSLPSRLPMLIMWTESAWTQHLQPVARQLDRLLRAKVEVGSILRAPLTIPGPDPGCVEVEAWTAAALAAELRAVIGRAVHGAGRGGPGSVEAVLRPVVGSGCTCPRLRASVYTSRSRSGSLERDSPDGIPVALDGRSALLGLSAACSLAVAATHAHVHRPPLPSPREGAAALLLAGRRARATARATATRRGSDSEGGSGLEMEWSRGIAGRQLLGFALEGGGDGRGAVAGCVEAAQLLVAGRVAVEHLRRQVLGGLPAGAAGRLVGLSLLREVWVSVGRVGASRTKIALCALERAVAGRRFADRNDGNDSINGDDTEEEEEDEGDDETEDEDDGRNEFAYEHEERVK